MEKDVDFHKYFLRNYKLFNVYFYERFLKDISGLELWIFGNTFCRKGELFHILFGLTIRTISEELKKKYCLRKLYPKKFFNIFLKDY